MRSRVAIAVPFLVLLSLFTVPDGVGASEGLLEISVDTTLAEDHRGPVVVAAGATLDCDGHSITWSASTPSERGVLVSSNATVRNCRVSGFLRGIAVESATGVLIESNDVSDAVWSGPIREPGTGILLVDAADCQVESNTSLRNMEGIRVDRGSNNQIVGNEVRDSAAYGIELRGGESSKVLDNTLTGNRYGAGLNISGNGHLVRSNTARSNLLGFEIWTSDSVYEDNDASGNRTGFNLRDGYGNDYIRNTANSNEHYGFYAYSMHLRPWFEANRCINNGSGGSYMSNHNGYICSEDGHFLDDNESIFELDIEWIADEGITGGCNPPLNTKFCPETTVTRGQMAAFLVRALGYTDRLDNPFRDDDGHTFEADIERLAAEGITKGCNPAEGNTRFCPDSYVTRGQMAAFLTRALGYTDRSDNRFTDDDGHTFEADIERLAAAGVTKGCNAFEGNTKFCPDDYVTRGQMAAFLHRALKDILK